MRFVPAVVVIVLAVTIRSGVLQAQRSPIHSIAASSAELSSAAELRLPVREIPRLDQRAMPADVHYIRASRRDGEILMIVGGALILTGLLVDEGLVAIAGAAIGGYGLYLYLRSSPRRR
jgi:hypothetical protein